MSDSTPQLLPPGWEERSLDGQLQLCRELVEDPNFPTVRKWREAGGKVVGHFPYSPRRDRIGHFARGPG